MGAKGIVMQKAFTSHYVIMPFCTYDLSGLILGMRPANEGRRYKVTPSLIGWAQT